MLHRLWFLDFLWALCDAISKIIYFDKKCVRHCLFKNLESVTVVAGTSAGF